MSKYIKLEDAIDYECPLNEIWEDCINCPLNNSAVEPCKMGKWLNSLPTIEVSGGDLEDAILLTKDAYSDLCLRAAQFSDKAECDNCIWDICNYNKIDWEVSEDCISKGYLEQEIENQAMTVEKDKEYWRGWNNALDKVVELIEDAPSVTTEQSSMVGERKDNE